MSKLCALRPKDEIPIKSCINLLSFVVASFSSESIIFVGIVLPNVPNPKSLGSNLISQSIFVFVHFCHLPAALSTDFLAVDVPGVFSCIFPNLIFVLFIVKKNRMQLKRLYFFILFYGAFALRPSSH